MSNRTKFILKEALSYVLIIGIAVGIAFFINNVFIVNARIPTTSMVPTINQYDRIIGNRLAYRNSDPKRGDIVIFPYPDDESETYVKRIIGLPGETVEIHDGKVFINGEELDESAYLDIDTSGTWGPYEVPYDSYFMLGDNRDISKDSRRWDNKYVKKDKIIAKAVFKYYKGFKKLK